MWRTQATGKRDCVMSLGSGFDWQRRRIADRPSHSGGKKWPFDLNGLNPECNEVSEEYSQRSKVTNVPL